VKLVGPHPIMHDYWLGNENGPKDISLKMGCTRGIRWEEEIRRDELEYKRCITCMTNFSLQHMLK